MYSKQIKDARKEQKMTQITLANKAKVMLKTVSEIENNKCNPTVETLRRIGNVLQIPLILKNNML